MFKKLKVFFLLIVFIMVFSYIIKYLNTMNLSLSNNDFISLIINKNDSRIISKIFTGITKNNNSNVFSLINSSKSESETLSYQDMSPIVYIYNTHQKEQYNGEELSNYNLELTVLTASNILQECLKKNNIGAIVEEKSVADRLKKRNLDYNKSYLISRELMLDSKKRYDSLQYFIDIHRDAVSGNLSTVIIDNKSYARPMFVIGMNNKYYQKNLTLFQKLNDGFNLFSKELSRGIYKRNSIYNQDLNENVVLIEIGGIDNNLEEIYNTTCLFADILGSYIKDMGEQNG